MDKAKDNPRTGFYIPEWNAPNESVADLCSGGSEGQYALHLPHESVGRGGVVDHDDWLARRYRGRWRSDWELKF